MYIIFIYAYVCIHICIYRERERERQRTKKSERDKDKPRLTCHEPSFKCRRVYCKRSHSKLLTLTSTEASSKSYPQEPQNPQENPQDKHIIEAKRPQKHKDLTKHDSWYPPHIVPWNQNLRSLCLCGLLGPYISAEYFLTASSGFTRHRQDKQPRGAQHRLLQESQNDIAIPTMNSGTFRSEVVLGSLEGGTPSPLPYLLLPRLPARPN